MNDALRKYLKNNGFKYDLEDDSWNKEYSVNKLISNRIRVPDNKSEYHKDKEMIDQLQVAISGNSSNSAQIISTITKDSIVVVKLNTLLATPLFDAKKKALEEMLGCKVVLLDATIDVAAVISDFQSQGNPSKPSKSSKNTEKNQ